MDRSTRRSFSCRPSAPAAREKGMPSWCALGMEMPTIDKIYAYVKGRSDAKLAAGPTSTRNREPSIQIITLVALVACVPATIGDLRLPTRRKHLGTTQLCRRYPGGSARPSRRSRRDSPQAPRKHRPICPTRSQRAQPEPVRISNGQTSADARPDRHQARGCQSVHLRSHGCGTHRCRPPEGQYGRHVLRRANLQRANLKGASLFATIIESADLSGAQLSDTRIIGYLRAAKLTGANLRNANIGADPGNQSMGVMRADVCGCRSHRGRSSWRQSVQSRLLPRDPHEGAADRAPT